MPKLSLSRTLVLSELKDKKILILGFSREGKDTYAFLKKMFPQSKIGIADQKTKLERVPKGAILYLGSAYLKAIPKYDVVISSPGVPISIIKKHLKKEQRLTSQTEIFISNTPGTVIGITGTKGKSTTASLIYTILKKNKVKAHLVGNIGKPVLNLLPRATKKDVFVYELSSFQLTLLKQSPHIAVLLNLYPEHLDWHGTLKAYIAAKANIARFQSKKDFCIFNAGDKEIKKIAALSKARKLAFKAETRKQTKFTASLKPALLVTQLFGISQKKALNAVKEFKPLEHRLEKVGTYKGITFYNDSLATIPEATIAAMDILGDNVATLIAGGVDRHISYTKLGKRIQKSSIKTLILFPDTGKKISAAVKNKDIIHVKTMEKAVKTAFEKTNRGKICLLSPASASFNLFRDYEDRGEQFKTYVKKYGKTKTQS